MTEPADNTATGQVMATIRPGAATAGGHHITHINRIICKKGNIHFYIVLSTAENVSDSTAITAVYLNTIRMSLRHTIGINMI